MAANAPSFSSFVTNNELNEFTPSSYLHFRVGKENYCFQKDFNTFNAIQKIEKALSEQKPFSWTEFPSFSQSGFSAISQLGKKAEIVLPGKFEDLFKGFECFIQALTDHITQRDNSNISAAKPAQSSEPATKQEKILSDYFSSDAKPFAKFLPLLKDESGLPDEISPLLQEFCKKCFNIQGLNEVSEETPLPEITNEELESFKEGLKNFEKTFVERFITYLKSKDPDFDRKAETYLVKKFSDIHNRSLTLYFREFILHVIFMVVAFFKAYSDFKNDSIGLVSNLGLVLSFFSYQRISKIFFELAPRNTLAQQWNFLRDDHMIVL